MAIRLFLVVGIVLMGLAGYLIVIDQPTAVQLPPSISQLAKFQAAGLVPGPNDVSENEEVEHSVFAVPPEDDVRLAAVLENSESMPGMDMGGTAMNGMDMGDASSPSVAMDGSASEPAVDHSTMAMDSPPSGATSEPAVDHSTMAMDSSTSGAMTAPSDGAAAVAVIKSESDTMKMPADGAATTAVVGPPTNVPSDETLAMTMDTFESGSVAIAPDDHAKMPMSGSGDGAAKTASDDHAEMGAMTAGMQMGKGGLLLREDGAYDREIELVAKEWGFSKMQIDVKMGERIRFNVRNGGQIPHEFMFMTMPAMAAVNYRAQRADWNLLEHEALFEQPLVLPGGDFSFVVTIQQAGSWMFMCMLPYHMEMGMMGQMATDGMAMKM